MESVFNFKAFKDGKMVTPTKGRELSKDIAVIHFGKQQDIFTLKIAGLNLEFSEFSELEYDQPLYFFKCPKLNIFEVFDDIINQVNIRQQIEIVWNNGSSYTFWGFIQEINPSTKEVGLALKIRLQ